jgi:hypothetical protein
MKSNKPFGYENEDSSPDFDNSAQKTSFVQKIKWFAAQRKLHFVFIILALILPFIIVVYSVIIPVGQYQAMPWSEQPTADTVSLKSSKLNKDQKELVLDIIGIEKEKVFQQNRLALASQDSIYLLVNLIDSTMNLEIKGVTVRTNKILDLEVSNRFRLISHENILPWLQKPFTLERALATIPKSPIIVKQAPKDTIEAAKMSTTPEPAKPNAVFFTFYFDRNLVIEVEQVNPPDEENLDDIKAYRRQKRNEARRSIWQSLNSARRADQPMSIKLIVSEEDAKAIYRAVPMKTHLILKI